MPIKKWFSPRTYVMYCLLLFHSMVSYGQITTTGIIQYDVFIDLERIDSSQSIELNTSNTFLGELFFSRDSSLYVYGEKTSSKTFYEDGQESENKIVVDQYGQEDGIQNWKHISKRQLQSLEPIYVGNNLDNYIVQETLPNLEWEIDWASTKKVGTFLCHRAQCSFRGRRYTAWFTRQVPVQHGPWKLWGLPGLILEASSDKREIVFFFKSISYPAPINRPIHITKKVQRISWVEYRDSWQKWAAMMEQYQRAQSSANSSVESTFHHMENIFNR